MVAEQGFVETLGVETSPAPTVEEPVAALPVAALPVANSVDDTESQPAAAIPSDTFAEPRDDACPDNPSTWLAVFEGISRGVYPFNQALYDALRHDRVQHALCQTKAHAELAYRRFSMQGGGWKSSPKVGGMGEREFVQCR